ncbi:hypothetical protein H5410_037667 [Solanum commersonii]|uniref:Uncharacterized protein n=1 Tax=Solanum commersonii TaxID=4109 RepID=A0A9J5Y6W9_SOLCO|nr:hypothetical protein H5410_037667 [Solanum commersonii]
MYTSHKEIYIEAIKDMYYGAKTQVGIEGEHSKHCLVGIEKTILELRKTKIEYLEYKFSDATNMDDVEVKIDTQFISKR